MAKKRYVHRDKLYHSTPYSREIVDDRGCPGTLTRDSRIGDYWTAFIIIHVVDVPTTQ